VLILLLAACADPRAEAEMVATVDCSAAPRVTWEGWGQGFFRTWCGACHAPEAQSRNAAPVGVSFETRADVATWRERIHTRVLVDQTMPVGGGLTEEDRALLDLLLACDR
jgi:uncharacterized membrane protein